MEALGTLQYSRTHFQAYLHTIVIAERHSVHIMLSSPSQPSECSTPSTPVKGEEILTAKLLVKKISD